MLVQGWMSSTPGVSSGLLPPAYPQCSSFSKFYEGATAGLPGGAPASISSLSLIGRDVHHTHSNAGL